ncbi:MAG: hypothetical protein ACRCX2_34865 [Paraclostridium sp.]
MDRRVGIIVRFTKKYFSIDIYYIVKRRCYSFRLHPKNNLYYKRFKANEHDRLWDFEKEKNSLLSQIKVAISSEFMSEELSINSFAIESKMGCKIMEFSDWVDSLMKESEIAFDTMKINQKKIIKRYIVRI